MTVDPGQMVPQNSLSDGWQVGLRWTPVHHELLEAVRAGQVEWLPQAGVSGAPGRLGSGRITEPLVLVAFFECRRHNLLVVHGQVVSLTFPGERRPASAVVWR